MLHTILNHCKIYVLTIPIRLFICITQWGVTHMEYVVLANFTIPERGTKKTRQSG